MGLMSSFLGMTSRSRLVCEIKKGELKMKNQKVEKWIKALIKVHLRTNSTPAEYWLDMIEKKYGVARDLFGVLWAEVCCGL